MKLCNYNFANSIFHQSYHLTVFVTFVLWHFCNGQINFVKFLRSSPPYPCNIVWWVNNTGCTMFSSTIIPLCNVWMLWIYVNDLLKTLRNTALVIVLLKKIIYCIFFFKEIYIYSIVQKWVAEHSEIGICLILVLCSHVGSEPTSAAIFVPNWVAGMADQKQYVLRTPQEQQIINVTSVCS